MTVEVPRAGTAHSADSVSHQGFASTGQLAVLVEQIALCGNADEGADRIKQIDKQEGKHNDDKVHEVFRNIAEIKLKKVGARDGKGV